MQDTSASTVTTSPDAPQAAQVSTPTALAQALGSASGIPSGARRVPSASPSSASFPRSSPPLSEGAGAFDLGYRGQIAVSSADRLRWLNGMLTNNLQELAEGTGNYSFVLNAQGRIQGDCDAFRMADHLLLLTDRSQVPALMAHFDHFIIMDDVALEDVSASRTALGLAGPLAPQLLAALGVNATHRCTPVRSGSSRPASAACPSN